VRVVRIVGVGVLTGTLMATAGCNATKREITVVFDPGTPDAQREAALRACTGAAPHTSPEPVVRPSARPGGPTRNVGITFRVDKANDRDLAHLESCLQKQPGVRGFQDSAA
jgi:hypothetical protein